MCTLRLGRACVAKKSQRCLGKMSATSFDKPLLLDHVPPQVFSRWQEDAVPPVIRPERASKIQYSQPATGGANDFPQQIHQGTILLCSLEQHAVAFKSRPAGLHR